ncbi:MAG TPA: hypothetical protein VE152_02110, partial [Acidimicrobiales bacterium]|nr:hypothetical protein [Acidimicrobiales bacterium]
GSTRLGQPRRSRSFFGGLGTAPRRLATVFAAQAALDAGWAAGAASGRVVAVSGARRLTRAAMVANTTVPQVVVPPDGSPVLVDGAPVTCSPAAQVPLGQLHHLA